MIAIVRSPHSLGPGTIFPIVIVFGAVVIAAATAAGAAAGTVVRRVLGVWP